MIDRNDKEFPTTVRQNLAPGDADAEGATPPEPSRPAELSIQDTARLSGIPEATLRIWEQRYGWPRPRRTRTSFRKYDPAIIPTLQRVQRLVALGRSIGSIIIDGEPRLAELAERRPFFKAVDCSSIPMPATSEARRLRERLEEALRVEDEATVQHLVALGATLHPTERRLAIQAVMALVRPAPPDIGSGMAAASPQAEAVQRTPAEPAIMVGEDAGDGAVPMPVAMPIPDEVLTPHAQSLQSATDAAGGVPDVVSPDDAGGRSAAVADPRNADGIGMDRQAVLAPAMLGTADPPAQDGASMQRSSSEMGRGLAQPRATDRTAASPSMVSATTPRGTSRQSRDPLRPATVTMGDERPARHVSRQVRVAAKAGARPRSSNDRIRHALTICKRLLKRRR